MTFIDTFNSICLFPFVKAVVTAFKKDCFHEDIKLAFRKTHLVPLLKREGKTYQTNSKSRYSVVKGTRHTDRTYNRYCGI